MRAKVFILLLGLTCLGTNAACADDAQSAQSQQASIFYPGSTEYRLAPRNALVVGVAGLKESSGFLSLKNPINDARAVTAALRAVGFSVMNLNETYQQPEQLTRQNIKAALYDFARILRSSGGVGLIYFSGHGVERDGQIYLVPYDAFVRFERDLSEELISVDFLHDVFAFAKNPLNIVILDSCRDNPWKALEQFGTAIWRQPSAGSGDTILANSTLSGKQAADGDDNLSPYARAFVASLSNRDQALSVFFGDIGANLHELQVPVITQPAGREFVFFPTISSFNQEKTIFDTGRKQGSREILKKLIWNYSVGYFAVAAQNWLNNASLAPAPSQ